MLKLLIIQTKVFCNRGDKMVETTVEKAWKTKYPEQIVLVVTASAKDTFNIITIGWVMPTSSLPPMIAVSIGHSRYSYKLIMEIGEFALCFPSVEQKSAVIFCGTHSGKEYDKFKETGLGQISSKYIKPPIIADSVAAFECRVSGSLKTGDHTIFAGEILTAYVSEHPLKRLYNFGEFFSGISQVARGNK